MDCVNHPGVQASAYCQNCGKAMCAACTRQQPGGQILCEPCSVAWQNMQAPYAGPAMAGVPNPAVATLLGFIPGVGAMYNGQFVKGFIHVAVFAVLVSMADHFSIFGLFIAAWIAYQVFDAHHTARARRDGDPLPDPLGLNELASWFHMGMQAEFRRGPGTGTAPVGTPPAPGQPAGATAQQQPPAAYTPPASGYTPPYQAPYGGPYQSGYQAPPFTGYPPPPPAAYGYPPDPGYGPPGGRWRRRPEPIAAIVLIAMGVLFLLGQTEWFSGRMFEYFWPLLLIALGAWLLVRRMNDVRPLPPPPPVETAHNVDKDSQGGML